MYNKKSDEPRRILLQKTEMENKNKTKQNKIKKSSASQSCISSWNEPKLDKPDQTSQL